MKQIHVVLSEPEAAYLAGLVDGEGCLNFYKTRSVSCRRGYTFVARLAISNCDVETLIGLREQLGIGSVVKKPTPQGNRRDGYNLCFYAREVRALLPLILPYLRIKRQQALLLMQYLGRQKWGGTKGGLDDAEWSERLRLHEQLRFLNRRGKREVVAVGESLS